MNSLHKTVSWLLVTAIVAGCAAPQTQRGAVPDSATKAEAERQMEIAAQDMVNDQKRLTRVYRQLAINAKALCSNDLGPNVGAYWMSKPKGDFGDTYVRLYGVKDQPTLLFTLDGGPADRAGLKPRDVLLSINGVSTNDKAKFEETVGNLAPDAPIVYGLDRSGAPITMTVQPDRACRYSAELSPDQVINAYADGKKIVVARGMMSFAKDDNELALVLSHEMAHNTMKHIDAKKQNMTGGMLADIAIAILSRGRSSNSSFSQLAAGAYSQEFEAEADYVGLYIMANAGMPINDAPQFWRLMAAAHPASIKTNHAASHPSTAYRMVALEQTVKEIDAKLARNEPLVPNMKDGKPAAPAQPSAQASSL